MKGCGVYEGLWQTDIHLYIYQLYNIWKCEHTVRERCHFERMTTLRSEMCNWFRQNPKLGLRWVCNPYGQLPEKPYLLLALGICLESFISEDLHHPVLC